MLLLLITGFVVFGLLALYTDKEYTASKGVILCALTSISYGTAILCLSAFLVLSFTGAY